MTDAEQMIRSAIKSAQSEGYDVRPGPWFGNMESYGMRCCAIGAVIRKSDRFQPIETAAKILGVSVGWVISFVEGYDGGVVGQVTPERHEAFMLGRRLRKECLPLAVRYP